MATDVSNVFSSERLVFRAMEDNEEDKAWFHKLKNDPTAFATADLELLRPQTRKRSDEDFLDMAKSTLAVVICLPPPPANETTPETAQQQQQQQQQPPKPTPIGILCLGETSGPAYWSHHRECGVVLQIVAGHRDKGYGTEALTWAVDWAFTYANMHRISLGVLEHNARGIHVYEKIGFRREGAYRSSHYHQRRYWDHLIYGMLEEEWVEMRRGTTRGS
ncbi:hypothetical protein MAPG_10148 [Magnaporthiopsis poae ATCC 64411]|uniref:N-acetyltransferase domain-containing protein n=1 Tax=Magnaporthiopsis poae (strain ATCC 64411 / 73-15) TaxID=644358 RepID=A0A0C4EBT9_MAGP6|nr:hypothetical protein MAPG_10148 [Magnaporthiopsis poae ATCC 64411]